MSQFPDRNHILSRGLGIASARGLDALSIGDLARELDMERRGLTQHFHSKASLQLGVMDQAAEMFQAAVITPADSHPPGEQKLRVLFDRWIYWSLGPSLKGGCPFVRASNDGTHLPPDVRQKLKEFLEQWTKLFSDSITAAVKSGAFSPDIDIDQLIFEIYGLYLSHHFWHWSMKDNNARARTMKAFDRLLENASTR